jgi:hypothetical protein
VSVREWVVVAKIDPLGGEVTLDLLAAIEKFGDVKIATHGGILCYRNRVMRLVN